MMQYINQGKKNDMALVFVCSKEIQQWLCSLYHEIVLKTNVGPQIEPRYQ